jgi:predicted TIM-barrel fold metal-dependent hydrolase
MIADCDVRGKQKVMMKDSVELFERTPMSDADREKVYHLNAERWLKLG